MSDIKNQLKAISLLDGRNWEKIKIVSDYFSEFALIRYRVRLEIEYLIFLSRQTDLVRKFTESEINLLRNIYLKFTLENAVIVKNHEKRINHDVKAVEYFIRDSLEKTILRDVTEFIHFGLTSYDINIPAYALMLNNFRNEVLLEQLNNILRSVKSMIRETKKMYMLARTHGQPALPTTMGKELSVYYRRLISETEILKVIKIEAKLTGAVGNFNALQFTAPKLNWIYLSKQFIQSLGLSPNIFTTQILPYDSWLRLFDSIKRINNILSGFCQDLWWYISFEFFSQQKKIEEVGSSTMAQKINPITFENAEGNLGVANSLFEYFVRKLSYSRLQRDLSDSTVKRDFGLAFGFTLLAWDSILTGLKKIKPNPVKAADELDDHWEIFSEGIQTYLRLKGFSEAFEKLKEKTRGRVLTKIQLYKLIDDLPIAPADKRKLKIKNLREYSGLAEKLSGLAIKN